MHKVAAELNELFLNVVEYKFCTLENSQTCKSYIRRRTSQCKRSKRKGKGEKKKRRAAKKYRIQFTHIENAGKGGGATQRGIHDEKKETLISGKYVRVTKVNEVLFVSFAKKLPLK